MKNFALNGVVAAATGFLLVIAAPASAAEHAWSPIQPSGGMARQFFIVGDDLWMNAGAALKSPDFGDSWIVQPQVPAGAKFAVSPHDSSRVFRMAQSKIHRSLDGGDTWSTIELPTTAVFGDFIVDIAFDQSDALTAYAAVQNVGIHVTVDGGDSWSVSPTQPVPTPELVSLVSDPHHPGVLYAGVRNAGIFKSTNSGASWTAVNTGHPLTWVDLIVFDPATPDVVFAGSGSAYVIYRSVNGGASWNAVTTGLPPNGLTPSAIEPGDEPGEFYATFDGDSALGPGARIFRSIDGGVTWAGLTPPVAARGPQTTAVFVDPAVSDRLVMGTRIGNFSSTDDGATWVWSNVGFNQAVVTGFAFGKEAGEIFVSSRLAGVLRTDDAGASWNHLNAGIEKADFVGIAVSPHDHQQVIATNFYGPFVSNDGGSSWDSTDYPNMVFNAIAFDPMSASTAYAIADGGSTLLRTMDGGVTWMDFPTGVGAVSSDVATKLVTSAITPGLLYFNHFHGIFKSSDGGETWAPANGNLPAATTRTVALGPDDVVYASFGGTVLGAYKSTDGAATWEQVWLGTPLDGGSLRALAFDPRDPQRMLATIGIYVYGSIDGGSNWIPLHDGVDTKLQYPNSLAFDPWVEGRYFLASGTSGTDGVLQVYSGGIAVDLDVSADAAITSVEIGETLDIEFSVSNLAGFPAETATLVVTTPDQFTLTNATLAGATCVEEGSTLECALPTVAMDAILTGTVTLTAEIAGTGSVTIAVDAHESDVDEANNAASKSVTATNPATTTPPPTTGGDPVASGGGGGSFSWLWLLALLLPVPARVMRRIG